MWIDIFCLGYCLELCKNEEIRKHAANEKTEQNSSKKTSQNGDKQSTTCRVQSTGYRMFNNLKENFNKVIKYKNGDRKQKITTKKWRI